MAYSLGYEEILWMRQAATYGEQLAMDGAYRHAMPIKAGASMKRAFSRIKSERITGSRFIQDVDDALGLESVTGSFSGLIPYKGHFGDILRNTLGKVTTSGPVGTKYTHTFEWNNLLFPGISIAMNKGGKTYCYHGCQIESLRFSFVVGEPVLYEVTLQGRNEVIVAELTPPDLTLLGASASPWILCNHIAFQGGGVVYKMTAIEFTFTNELQVAEDRSYELGSNKRVCLVASGASINGTLSRRHLADGAGNGSIFHDWAASNSMAGFKITATHPSDSDYSLDINFFVKATETAHDAADAGIIMEDVPFEGYQLDHYQSEIILTDANADPPTETGAYAG